MRSLEYTIIQYDWCACKKEKSQQRETQAWREDDGKTHKEKNSHMTETMYFEAKER